MARDSEIDAEEDSNEEQKELLAGDCPICEGDLAAEPDAKTVKCKNCGYEEPAYAEE